MNRNDIPSGELDCPFDFTGRCSYGRCGCLPKNETLKHFVLQTEQLKEENEKLRAASQTFREWLDTQIKYLDIEIEADGKTQRKQSRMSALIEVEQRFTNLLNSTNNGN